MSDETEKSGQSAPSNTATPDAKDDRQARLDAALRANLKKRKSQARARKTPPGGSENGPETSPEKP